MASPQPWSAKTAFGSGPRGLAEAAAVYQRHREIEAKQLAVMAGYNLLEPWTSEAQAAVLEARVHVRAARDAREDFRSHVAEAVRTLRAQHVELGPVLRQIKTILDLLQESGVLRNDGGWLEAEVLEWAIDEFERLPDSR